MATSSSGSIDNNKKENAAAVPSRTSKSSTEQKQGRRTGTATTAVSSKKHPGDIVKIGGLQNAPQYNGLLASVRSEPKLDRVTGICRQQVQLFRTPPPAQSSKNIPMKMKPENLVLVVSSQEDRYAEQDAPEWTIPKLGKSMFQFIRQDPLLRSIDACHEFAIELWSRLAETPPAHPLTLDHGYKFRQELMDSSGHKLYWLGMDAICHHLLLEKCGPSSWRVYQSYLIDEINGGGFTAGEWCGVGVGGTSSRSRSILPFKAAWQEWGGGKVLNNQDINKLFDVIVEWQQLTKELQRKVLLPSVPGLDRRAVSWLTNAPSHTPVADVVQQEIQKIVNWSKQMIDLMVGPMGLTMMGLDPEDESPMMDISILIGSEQIFSIPKALFQRCYNLSKRMTGEPVCGAIFLNMLNSGVWWEYTRDPEDGGANGFYVRACNLAQDDLSVEEGIRQNIERKERMRKNATIAGNG
jgi:hypothetical protein